MGGIGVRRGGRSPGGLPQVLGVQQGVAELYVDGQVIRPEVHEISSSADPLQGDRDLLGAEPDRYRLPSWIRGGPALKNVTTPVVADPRARAGMRISVVMIRY